MRPFYPPINNNFFCGRNNLMALTGETVPYPLAVGNKCKMSNGGSYTNSITGVDGTNPNLFTLHNTSNNLNSFMRKDGDI
jgi:hypothetical protein